MYMCDNPHISSLHCVLSVDIAKSSTYCFCSVEIRLLQFFFYGCPMYSIDIPQKVDNSAV